MLYVKLEFILQLILFSVLSVEFEINLTREKLYTTWIEYTHFLKPKTKSMFYIRSLLDRCLIICLNGEKNYNE